MTPTTLFHAAEVRAVKRLNPSTMKLQRALLSHFHLPAQARIKADVIGTNAGVASNPRRTSVVEWRSLLTFVPASRIKRMRAVVTKNRRQLKAGKDTTLPRTLNHARDHHLVPAESKLERPRSAARSVWSFGP